MGGEGGGIVTVDKLRNPGVHRWGTALSVSSSSASQMGAGGEGVEVDPLLGQKRRVGTAFAEDVVVSSALFGVTEDGRTIVSCGHWDNSFQLTNLDGKQSQRVSWHKVCCSCSCYLCCLCCYLFYFINFYFQGFDYLFVHGE